jgi:hypothetical protein
LPFAIRPQVDAIVRDAAERFTEWARPSTPCRSRCTGRRGDLAAVAAGAMMQMMLGNGFA